MFLSSCVYEFLAWHIVYGYIVYGYIVMVDCLAALVANKVQYIVG